MDTKELFNKQLEELQLVTCSLLPSESITYLEDELAWTNLLEGLVDGSSEPLPNLRPPHFQIKVENARIWFDIDLSYINTSRPPQISVKGDDMTRSEQERWQQSVKNKMPEIADTEFQVYQLISLHLLPLLHEELQQNRTISVVDIDEHGRNDSQPYHALFTSHHLISPNKRRSLQQWTSSLQLSGFAKVGYPGVIYVEGERENIEEFVDNVKAMQWLALKVRFVEPLGERLSDIGRKRRWIELHKVGEVVEEMRKLGREECIVEMGIGSAGTN